MDSPVVQFSVTDEIRYTLHFALCTLHSVSNPITYGGVAQLGEHLPCKQGVMGSIPIISTKGTRWRMKATEITEWAHSSGG